MKEVVERMMNSEKVTVPKLENCARCGKKHLGLVFKKLTHPLVFPGTYGGDDSEVLTHWCECPTNGEPILLEITDDI